MLSEGLNGMKIQLQQQIGIRTNHHILGQQATQRIFPSGSLQEIERHSMKYKYRRRISFRNYRSDELFNSVDDIPDIHVKTPLQRSIQLLKRHRDIYFSNSGNEKYKPISMIITVLAAQIYQNESSINETLTNLIYKLFEQSQQIQPTFRFNESFSESTYNLITRTSDGKWKIPNPTNYGENFADKWHENDHARAKVFFQWVTQVYEELNSSQEKSVTSSSGTQLMNFNVPHKQDPGLRWTLKLTQNVEILASYNENGFWTYKDMLSSYLLKNGGAVKRYRKICFRAKTNIPTPYSVYWQVVNTGREAVAANGLRGGFYDCNGEPLFELDKNVWFESTEYRGNHWIECFIVKNGICVARSGEFVVKIV